MLDRLHGNRWKDISGQRFGQLTVLSFHSKTRTGQSRWLCECSCGKQKDILGLHLLAGRIISCGCRVPKGKEHKSWTGHEELSGQEYGSIRRGANGSKGRPPLEFQVSQQYLWELFLKQDRKCALSGVPIYLRKRWKESGTASLDRIDSSLGYIEGNVQWVHKDVNLMKNKLDQTYFIEMCKSIAGACSLD